MTNNTSTGAAMPAAGESEKTCIVLDGAPRLEQRRPQHAERCLRVDVMTITASSQPS